jgi:hypothetical protein
MTRRTFDRWTITAALVAALPLVPYVGGSFLDLLWWIRRAGERLFS